MENKICFLVSSAIVTKFGDFHKRALMTINTINSINANCPGSKIVLLECGQGPIPQKYLDHFPSNVAVIPYWSDGKIKHIVKEAAAYRNLIHEKFNDESCKNLELGYVKSRTETYVFSDFLNRFEFEGIDFVFKLSGRYCLTPKFNANNWTVDGKLVFREPQDTPYESLKELSGTKLYTTWLWGFSTKILDEVRMYYGETRKHLMQEWLSSGVCDIEHGLWKTVPQDMVHIVENEFGRTGVLCFDMGGIPNNNLLL